MEIKHLNLGMVNAYLVKSQNGLFLIDTGFAMGRKKLEKLLLREGIKPADINLVIITHGDMDHIGNCAYLQNKYHLKIAVHTDDAYLCRTGERILNRIRKASLLTKMLKFVLSLLVIKPLTIKYPLTSFEPDIILSGGQDLNQYGLDAKIVHIPGHSKGSIGILTGNGDFFSGDTINNRKKPATADIIQDEAALLSSLDKINKINIRDVYPGHGRPFPMADLTF